VLTFLGALLVHVAHHLGDEAIDEVLLDGLLFWAAGAVWRGKKRTNQSSAEIIWALN
jgi:hypothetical protein